MRRGRARTSFVEAAVCIALAIGCSGAHAAHAAHGVVSYVAGGDVFLNKGSDDGIAAGASVDLVRRKRAVGACQVRTVSRHHAVCAASAAEPGDRFTLPPAPPKPAAAAPRPPLASDGVLAVRRQALEAAPTALVPYRGPRQKLAEGFSASGSATLRHQAFITFGQGAGFERPSLSLAARAGLGFVPGLYAAAAARLQGDVLSPERHRTRADSAEELYLWQAMVGLDGGALPVVGALGRIQPHAPGLFVLDGAQMGARFFDGALEVGAYAGTVPDALTIMPGVERVAGGAYLLAELAPTRELLLLPSARVGVLGLPDSTAGRLEAEGALQSSIGSVASAGASVRAGLPSDTTTPELDAVRVDGAIAAFSALRVQAGYRYLAPLALDVDASATVPAVLGAHHADLSASWTATSWITLGAVSGGALDVRTSALRGWVGPELVLPELFGSIGGLSLLHLEEPATVMPGRSTSVTASLRPASFLSLLGRATLSEDQAPLESLRHAGLFILVQAPVAAWLSLRAAGQVQGTLPTFEGTPRAQTGTALIDVGVTGAL